MKEYASKFSYETWVDELSSRNLKRSNIYVAQGMAHEGMLSGDLNWALSHVDSGVDGIVFGRAGERLSKVSIIPKNSDRKKVVESYNSKFF